VRHRFIIIAPLVSIAFLLAASLAVGASPAAASGFTFAPHVEYGAPIQPAGVVIADFDNDGLDDVATCNFYSDDTLDPPYESTVSIFLSASGGGFSSRTDYVVGKGPCGIVTGDFNGDDKKDLATGNGNANTVSVLIGKGDGTFFDHVDYPSPNGPYMICRGDLNGDGDQDLVIGNYFTRTVSVLLGNGDGTFGAATTYATGGEDPNPDPDDVLPRYGFPYAITLGDVDNDGKKDIALAIYFGDHASVLLGNGDGTFGAYSYLDVGGDPLGVAVADFDADGKNDLATANYWDNTVSVLLGTGGGAFAAKVDYPCGLWPHFLMADDLNNDGIPDLTTADTRDSTASVLLGVGDGTFAPKKSYMVGLTPFCVAAGDVNGDGLKDLASANCYGNSFGLVTQIVDDVAPVTLAPYKATVVRGRRATLRYRVNDAEPNGGAADVTIVVKTLTGRTVRTAILGSRQVNAPLTYRFRCTLRKKTYKFFVYATDTAGNVQATIGSNRLVVK
jgi:hypothetical protein